MTTAARRLVVTGASSGIGQAVAATARQRGWAVLASIRRDADRAGLERLGCTVERLELRDAAAIDAFAATAIQWCDGRLDALVNNAAVALPGPVEELPLAEIRDQFEINVFGQIHLTQALLPGLRVGGGRILFVSSDRAAAAVPGYGAYVASKRALEAFAEVLAAELAPARIGVTILELGSFDSAIRGPIAARLAECARTTRHYGALIAELAAVLGRPPLLAPERAAEVILDLLFAAPPPLVVVFPPSSEAKVLRQRLGGLQRDLEALLRDAAARDPAPTP